MRRYVVLNGAMCEYPYFPKSCSCRECLARATMGGCIFVVMLVFAVSFVSSISQLGFARRFSVRCLAWSASFGLDRKVSNNLLPKRPHRSLLGITT